MNEFVYLVCVRDLIGEQLYDPIVVANEEAFKRMILSLPAENYLKKFSENFEYSLVATFYPSFASSDNKMIEPSQIIWKPISALLKEV